MVVLYILESQKTGRYYVGCTEDIIDRVKKHNRGEVISTKAYLPWILKYKEEYSSLVEGRKRERQIKNWKKRSAIEKLINK